MGPVFCVCYGRGTPAFSFWEWSLNAFTTGNPCWGQIYVMLVFFLELYRSSIPNPKLILCILEYETDERNMGLGINILTNFPVVGNVAAEKNTFWAARTFNNAPAACCRALRSIWATRVECKRFNCWRAFGFCPGYLSRRKLYATHTSPHRRTTKQQHQQNSSSTAVRWRRRYSVDVSSFG